MGDDEHARTRPSRPCAGPRPRAWWPIDQPVTSSPGARMSAGPVYPRCARLRHPRDGVRGSAWPRTGRIVTRPPGRWSRSWRHSRRSVDAGRRRYRRAGQDRRPGHRRRNERPAPSAFETYPERSAQDRCAHRCNSSGSGFYDGQRFPPRAPGVRRCDGAIRGLAIEAGRLGRGDQAASGTRSALLKSAGSICRPRERSSWRTTAIPHVTLADRPDLNGKYPSSVTSSPATSRGFKGRSDHADMCESER